MWKLIHNKAKYITRGNVSSTLETLVSTWIIRLQSQSSLNIVTLCLSRTQVTVVKHHGVLQRRQCWWRAHVHPQIPGGTCRLFRRVTPSAPPPMVALHGGWEFLEPLRIPASTIVQSSMFTGNLASPRASLGGLLTWMCEGQETARCAQPLAK